MKMKITDKKENTISFDITTKIYKIQTQKKIYMKKINFNFNVCILAPI